METFPLDDEQLASVTDQAKSIMSGWPIQKASREDLIAVCYLLAAGVMEWRFRYAGRLMDDDSRE